MPLRVAFDLDGVLADMESRLVCEATKLFGEQILHPARNDAPPAAETAADGETPPALDRELPGDIPLGDVPPIFSLRLTTHQQRRLWRHVSAIERFWETLDETEPGTVARLAELAAGWRWEVIFLTRRPDTAGATAQIQTQHWLEAKGFALPSVFVVRESRGRIAAALDLDLMVDDRPENCLDVVVDSDARAILVWRQDEAALPAAARRLGIGIVRSVDEALGILTEIDSAADRTPLVDRVKRLLGLGKEPAAS